MGKTRWMKNVSFKFSCLSGKITRGFCLNVSFTLMLRCQFLMGLLVISTLRRLPSSLPQPLICMRYFSMAITHNSAISLCTASAYFIDFTYADRFISLTAHYIHRKEWSIFGEVQRHQRRKQQKKNIVCVKLCIFTSHIK